MFQSYDLSAPCHRRALPRAGVSTFNRPPVRTYRPVIAAILSVPMPAHGDDGATLLPYFQGC
jgi:hypothetical protein